MRFLVEEIIDSDEGDTIEKVVVSLASDDDYFINISYWYKIPSRKNWTQIRDEGASLSKETFLKVVSELRELGALETDEKEDNV